MKEKDILNLLSKAEELKVIQFLEEVINFVRDIKPQLNAVNASIADNVVRMPSASKKLAKVTEATEVATNEIMNTLDTIFSKTDKLSKNLDIIDSSKTEIVNDSKNILDDINNDANNIMMALQVQDITSQQIAAVNHILTNVQSKLAEILSSFEMSSIKELIEEYRQEQGIQTSVLHREIAFDPHAVDSIAKKEHRQGDVDDLISKIQAGETIDTTEESADDDDIDALLAQFGEVGASFADSTNTANEEFSQDDIDALFGN